MPDHNHPIHLNGRLICATPADAALVAAHLPTHIALSRAEPGCLAFDVTPTADPMIWAVSETFVDQMAFDAHQTRTRASDWYRHTGHIRREFAVRAG
jgi:quinol monooxygenase YgiN